jgi:tRNA (guanine-N7-)-methyltransferase
MTVRRGKRLPLGTLEPYLLTAPEPPARLSWPALFGNDRPVELEVGFGKGLFLVTSAQARPDVNFVGIEIVRKYQLFTATRIAKRGLTNVRLACADAKLFLRDAVEAASVHVLHVYFPDPWWKKRHHKRRLFTSEFVQEAVRVLRPGGLFSIATDVGEYFEVMKDLLGTTLLEALPPPEPDTPAHDLDYLTNFERKARKKGSSVHRLLLCNPVSP